MPDALPTSEITLPSSPTPPPVFSDAPARASSPPSSPPGFPWEKASTSVDASTNPPPPPTNKTAFSILGKRKPLKPLSENARPTKKAAPSSKATKPERNSLRQMQISLGQEVQKKCKTCGMEYVPSSAEDRKLHDRHHRQNTEGYDVGGNFVRQAPPDTVFEGRREGDAICVVDWTCTPARKKKGQAVLEIVQRELGAVEIPEREVWGRPPDDSEDFDACKFRAYLYIRGSKCVGFLLEQGISEAYRVVEPPSDPPSQAEMSNATGALSALQARQRVAASKQNQPIEFSKSTSPARMGISRIWTSALYRHQNIATALLDTAFEQHDARDEFVRKAKVKAGEATLRRSGGKEAPVERDAATPVRKKMKSKELVAFTQPTAAGARLARRWFGRVYGWGVYVD